MGRRAVMPLPSGRDPYHVCPVAPLPRGGTVWRARSCRPVAPHVMFNTEKFIECVHDKPPLWNPQYSNRGERDQCWGDIGETMYPDWPQLDLRNKDLRVQEMKKKWRHVRDHFFRQVKQTRSGVAPAKRKNYIYADALAFLLDFDEVNPQFGDISVDQTLQDELDEIEATEVLLCEIVEDNVPEDEPTGSSLELENPREISNRPTRSPQKKIQEPRDQQKSYKEKIPEPKSETTNFSSFQNRLLKRLDDSSEDCDRMYLLSLLSDFKKLDPDEKLEFKMMNLQYFQSVHQRRTHPGPARQPQPWIQVNFPLPGVSGAPGTSLQYYPTQVPAQPTASRSTQTPVNTSCGGISGSDC